MDFPTIDSVLATPPVAAEEGEEIGRSREGRPIRAFAIGHGPLHVSLIGGCHADEPVGPWMLARLVGRLREASVSHRAGERELLERVSWRIVPHVNPDGEAKNRSWSGDGRGSLDSGIDLTAYLRHRERERPGDDIEFGFPSEDADRSARPENLAVADWIRANVERVGPIALHVSFHGMGFAGGPWFLVDRAWIDRTRPLRRHLADATASLGYALHDVQRHGEKGFDRIDRGFCTRPDSASMRRFFEVRADARTAARFRPSSMELARRLSGDPLTLVSEMPLFVVDGVGDRIDPSDPIADRFRDATLPALEQWARSTGKPEPPVRIPRPMPLADQMDLQLRFLDEGLASVRADRSR